MQLRVNKALKRWLAAYATAIVWWKQRVLYSWIIFHLLFIFVVNAVTVYSSYKEFHREPNTFPLALTLEKWLNSHPARYYGRYTGAETGYGFFGINVRSNGLLMGECAGEGITADFHSYETSLRFFSMGNALTDDLMKPGSLDSLHKNGADSMMSAYNQLVFRNIAVTLFQRHHCQDTTTSLSYNLLDFPTLAAVKIGAAPDYTLVKLITVDYSLRTHDIQFKNRQ
ncbi:hypothetical protein [Chitinophaga nivalis]|uniref:Uncharacterized protein n=1 Tax=Chitinophaga nivalis TaxID=2991709 RepID=A0ABT3ISS8_9BACT|nr:hypothetical protein [Chitinophaga nivalis]MCW3463535.1 hypothetical protein [Chitinophaga nivalis]MCW3486775.1 hypothetical protein [Chitinophaga nivalis]